MTEKKNIVLVGFMGTGKSSVAKLLARWTGRTLVEMDDEIEKKEGMSINQIFSTKGENHFRRREREVVEELSARRGLVVSTGGGVVLNGDNIRDFKTGGIVVCLDASPETVYRRVKHESHRPLLQTPDPLAKIKELLAFRAPFYAKADAKVSTDGKSVDQVAEEIAKIADEKA